MQVIVGLGNPGRRYAGTRHNVGFMVVDRLAERWSIQNDRNKFRSIFGRGVIGGQSALLVKPQTFMNLSGEAVVPWIRYFRASLSDLLVVHDDLDIAFGRLKLVRKGGPGGHKGVSSIQHMLGDRNIARLKIGIGRPRFDEPIEEYVLRPFYKDQDILDDVLERAADAVERVIVSGLDTAMTEVNKN